MIARLVVLAIVFVAVPLIIYNVFSAADAEKQSILVEAVRDKGLVIAAALQPVLAKSDGVPFEQLSDELARFGSANTAIRLLFKPTGGTGFYYVASVPAVPIDQLNVERQHLADIGVLDKLAETCSGNLPLAVRVAGPGGSDELITSITPVQSQAGCGALVISNAVRGINGVAIGEPYWKSDELRIALIIYAVMAVLVFAMFLSLWGHLSQFGRLARGIERADAGDSFAALNRIPELAPVAADFDRMVETLKASADGIRRAAEDNAHAFKSPLGVMRQALEPLHRRVGPDDTRAVAALQALSASLNKLEGLVHSARRLDEATADLLDPSTYPVDVSGLMRRLIQGYREVLGADAARLVGTVQDGLAVLGRDDLIETIVENLIDNALSFSPPGGEVGVAVGAFDDRVAIAVSDRGPGVAEERLPRIFDRYYSDRPLLPRPDGDDDAANSGEHFGIGLWLVRRHTEALKGQVIAENRPGGGLLVTVMLPRLVGRLTVARGDRGAPSLPQRA
ncbi:MAG TPA: HAMP domain-containing sensor histidine kinase [Candidatus Sulfotelmatobacter sp.]|nr:HAMP domain-containing sensor histidine kinase [Candidatus Sulfotelmatobacter sp.]